MLDVIVFITRVRLAIRRFIVRAGLLLLTLQGDTALHLRLKLGQRRLFWLPSCTACCAADIDDLQNLITSRGYGISVDGIIDVCYILWWWRSVCLVLLLRAELLTITWLLLWLILLLPVWRRLLLTVLHSILRDLLLWLRPLALLLILIKLLPHNLRRSWRSRIFTCSCSSQLLGTFSIGTRPNIFLPLGIEGTICTFVLLLLLRIHSLVETASACQSLIIVVPISQTIVKTPSSILLTCLV